MHFFPYWIYFVSIAHVYCKQALRNVSCWDYLAQLGRVQIFSIPFKLWEIYSNSFLERTMELSESVSLSTASPNQLWYLKDTSLSLSPASPDPLLHVPCPAPPPLQPFSWESSIKTSVKLICALKVAATNIFWAWQQMSAGARSR